MANHALVLLGGAAIFAAGLGVGLLLRGGPGSSATSTPAPLTGSSADAAGAELERIEALVRDIRAALGPTNAPSVPRTDATRANEPALDLRAELAALTQELRAARASAAPASSRAVDGQGPVFPTPAAAIENFRRLAAIKGGLQQAYDQTQAAFYFWRTEDVLLRFGVPSAAQASGIGLELVYRLPPVPPDPPWSIAFSTLEGRVVSTIVALEH